jgi:hypothetical protein
MKQSLPLVLFALLASAGTGASAYQAQVIVKCSASGGDCEKEPAPPAPSAPNGKPVLPPDKPGDAGISLMVAPSMMGPPSLAAPSMPPNPAIPVAPTALAEIPEAAHAACAKRKNGSKMTVKLGPHETLAGVCRKESGKMRFQMRHHHVG